MNEEQRMAEVEKFKNYFSYISRPGADKLLAWLEEAGFFTAPASTKYHGAYAGGAGRAYKLCIPQIGSAGRRRGQKTGQNVPGIYSGHNRSCSAST